MVKTIAGVTTQAEGPMVLDKGAGSAAFDGDDAIPGQELFPGSGALRFVRGTPQVFGYDKNGNMSYKLASSKATLFVYNAENQMTQVKQNGSLTASFSYDGDSGRTKHGGRTEHGARVKSLLGATTTLFIGAHFEWTGYPAAQQKYYDAGGARVAMRTGSGTGTTGLVFLLGDHLGSTSVTYDATNGQSRKQLDEACSLRPPWGEVRYTSAALQTKYTYTGQYSNVADFGLMFYRSRWYDPYLNRWDSPDTVVPDYYNPQSWDRYSYVRNNPVNMVDPSGHKECFEEDEMCIRWTTDGSYRIVNGGKEFPNRVEVAIANFILSNGEETQWLSTFSSVSSNCPSCLARSIDWVVSNLGFGDIIPLFELVVDPYLSLPIFAGLISPFGYPSNPATPPGPDWVWRGKGQPGSNQGNWWNSKTGEWLHYDTRHHGVIHYDYRAPDGQEYWIWPDGTMTLKR